MWGALLTWLRSLQAAPVAEPVMSEVSGDDMEPLPDNGTLGEFALEIAESEMAHGACEEPNGSNRGPYIDKYLMGQAKKGSSWNWCGLFVSWCVMHAAAIRSAPIDLSLQQRAGAKKLGKELVKLGATAVHPPRRGDIAIFHRGKQVDGKWSWQGHVAFVQNVHGQSFYTVGGNEGGRVKRTKRELSDKRNAGFLRLEL